MANSQMREYLPIDEPVNDTLDPPSVFSPETLLV
jgi:hypothetical protein